MKYLALILLFVLTVLDANAGTCTADSRTNVSANSVLTSTKYNSDLNTIYNRLSGGTFDGGCVADGSLEVSALDSTFDNVINAIKAGCVVSKSDAATISVSKCVLGINGGIVRTTTATTVTWGCTSCSTEAASTKYYIYALTTSTGTTLNLLISTTAPNDDGFDNSNNRVLGEFYNDASSNIDSQVNQWHENKHVAETIGGVYVALNSVSAGTNGGSAVSGSWATHSLDSLSGHGGWASLSTNQITLLAGTYHIYGYAQGCKTDGHKTRIYDVTNTATLIVGETTTLDSTAFNCAPSNFGGVVTLSDTTTIRLEQRVETTQATTGYGRAASFGENEVYAMMTIVKLN